jgi:hypothetical protein
MLMSEVLVFRVLSVVREYNMYETCCCVLNAVLCFLGNFISFCGPWSTTDHKN